MNIESSKERKYRVTNLTNRMNQEIIVHSHLIDGLNFLIETIRKFDGHVANARIVNSIDKSTVPHNMTISYTPHSITICNHNNRYYTKADNTSDSIHCFRHTIQLSVNSENRLQAGKTVDTIKLAIQNQKSEIKSLRKDINSFDDEDKDYKAIRVLVEAYNKKYNYPLKRHITMS